MRKALIGLLAILLLLPLLLLGGLAVLGLERFRPWIERTAEAALGRPVAIEGGLRLGWSLRPTIVVEGLRIGGTAEESAGELARVGRLELRLALLPLLAGKVEVDRLLLADAEVTLPAAGAGAAGGGGATSSRSAAGGPAPVPSVGEVRLERVRLVLPAEAGRPALVLALATLDAAMPDPDGRLEVEARGALGDRPLALRLGLTSPRALLDRRPVRLDPLALGLAGSDLSGALEVDPGGPRPKVEGALSSRRLEPAVLAGLLAGERGAADAGPGRRGAGEGRLVPDTAIDLAGLRGIEARVDLAVAELVVGGATLHDLVLPVTVGGGRLLAGPFAATVAGGRIGGRLEADGGQPQASLRLGLEARGLAIGVLQRELGTEPTVEAPLDLDLELAGRGRSLRALLASADGELTAAIGSGRIRALALDRFAGGVRELTRTLLADPGDGWVELRCGAFDLPVQAGVAQLRVAVVETTRARLTGEGRIDLGAERLEVSLLPRSRGATLNVAVPLRIRGPLAAPEIALDQREATRRAALGLLGALAFPPAAVAAFADLGAGGSPCLAAEAAPVEAPAAGPSTTLPGGDALRRGLEGLFGGGRR